MADRNWKTNSVHTKKRLAVLRDHLAASSLICVDLETVGPLERLAQEKGARLTDKEMVAANTNPFLPGSRASAISFTTDLDPDWGHVVPLSHPGGPWSAQWRRLLKALAKHLLALDVPLVGHNFKYDAKVIRQHTGIDLTHLLEWETLDGAHIINENRSKRLKDLAKHLMGGDWSEAVDLSNSEKEEWFRLARYAAADTVATWRLMEHQRTIVTGPLLDLYRNITIPNIWALGQVEFRGMLVDEDETKRALYDATVEMMDAEQDLLAVARGFGMDPEDPDVNVSWASASKWFKEFADCAIERDLLTVLSISQKTGEPSWDKKVLNQLSNPDPFASPEERIANLVLGFRHGQKQTEYLKSWLDLRDDAGRVHTNYRTTGTRTGRLSSSSPNVQQISRELKDCWVAPKGWSFVELDFSQVEIRVMAEFIHRDVLPDNPMMEAYRKGWDIHTMTTAAIVGRPQDTVTKDERQKGKAVALGRLFGQGSAGFQNYALGVFGLRFTVEESVESGRAYFDLWKGLKEWHQFQTREVYQRGRVTDLFGRVRHLPDIFLEDGYERGQAERQAINFPIQSTASNIMQRAFTLVEKRLTSEGVRAVVTVHDSGGFEIPTSQVEALVPEIAKIMLDPDLEELGVRLTVPLTVEAEWGQRWGSPTGSAVFTNMEDVYEEEAA